MPDILTGERGTQQQAETFAGPSSYPTGGFSHRTDLGRVDAAAAEIDNGSFVAHVESINDNNALVVQVFSQGGGEADAGTDLSADTVTTESYRL